MIISRDWISADRSHPLKRLEFQIDQSPHRGRWPRPCRDIRSASCKFENPPSDSDRQVTTPGEFLLSSENVDTFMSRSLSMRSTKSAAR